MFGCLTCYLDETSYNFKDQILLNTKDSTWKQKVKVKRDGKYSLIKPKYLVPGDIIQLNTHMAIPADIRIISCSSDMQINQSSFKEDSEPKKVDPNPLNYCARSWEAANLCFFGSFVCKGEGIGVVIATGCNTDVANAASRAAYPDTYHFTKGMETYDISCLFIKVSIIYLQRSCID